MFFASRRTFNSGLRYVLSRTLALSLAGFCAFPAMADDLSDVSQLLRSGQHVAALAKADAFLNKNPRDAQMRFLKGVILTEQNKSAEAIAIFSKLTDDYPTLPEPYNNLAVLYASSGQYEKARTALDMAIRTNPTYATAYENLGDVHAKLASQAYDKALQLDNSNTGAKSKLTMVRTLVGNTNGGTNPKVAVVAAAPSAPAKVEIKPEPKVETKPPVKEVPKVEPKVEPKSQAKPEVKAEAKPDPKAEQKQAQKLEAEAKREAKAKANAAEAAEREQVMSAVNAWAKAWSARDVKAYLNAYSSEFDLPAGQTRKAWSDERRARIEDKGRISVKIETPQVTVNGNTATVKFRQIYDSDRTKANSRKTMVLIKQSGKWHIKQERAGS
ncbi:L,D-transpeptidase Cds6 family protein [Herminiimonas fonticola]|uniref:Tetratricopeptide repeat protein n=1 Tax=Herminiimonas fonticola TaxID=303380 RepID=A0A4R6G5M0_9BURK|nr:tetratricopeptide repeat protein [Herminiimonas fonticola]RBA23807.1 TPR repeat [Herminiimonas fonticola]TDN89809.1 tetratricopeptide repeat protein [Herminiimonas fonticola]